MTSTRSRANFSISLGVAHEIGFALAMTSSVAIVLLGGALPIFAWLVCAAPWVSMLLARKRISPPALSATLVGAAGIALGVVAVARGGIESSVLAGTEMLMGLLVARLLVRKTPAHDLQALALSLLLVLAGSVLNVKLTYLGFFITYSIAAVWSLSTRQLVAGAGASADVVKARVDVVTPVFFAATAAISLAVLASAVLVFAAFPRVGFGDIGAFMHKETRLPGAVGLRGDPRLTGGNNVVARVRNVPRDAFDRGLYLRGAVYDVITLDGFSQSNVVEEKSAGLIELADAPVRARYELTVMPVVGDTLLTLGGVNAIRTLGGGNANPNVTLGVGGRSSFDELKAFGPLVSAMRYDVAGGIAAPGFVPKDAARHAPKELTDRQRSRWLQKPADFDAPLQKLADDVVIAAGAGTPAQKASALRRWFIKNFAYSLDPPRFAKAPLRTFLTEDRRAHCEFFASGYALLLRAEGIPARVVGGFQGGAWDDGVVVFADKNAHAWVEWWDDDAGWIVDDATPLALAAREELGVFDSAIERARRLWDDTVLDYSLQDQTDAVAAARKAWSGSDGNMRALLAGLAIPAAAALAFAALRRRRRKQTIESHPLAKAIVAALERVARTPIAPSSTLREAVDACGAGAPPTDATTQTLRDALAAYESTRFGTTPLSAHDLRAHVRALKRLPTARSAR